MNRGTFCIIWPTYFKTKDSTNLFYRNLHDYWPIQVKICYKDFWTIIFILWALECANTGFLYYIGLIKWDYIRKLWGAIFVLIVNQNHRFKIMLGNLTVRLNEISLEKNLL